MRNLLNETIQTLNADRLLVTRVTDTQQHVVARAGRPLPAAYAEVMPISHSICQHTVHMRFPLRIDNALLHPLLTDSAAVQELNIGAYLGMPFGADYPNMALCALSSSPRNWTRQDMNVLTRTLSALILNHDHLLGIDEAPQLHRRSA